MSLKKYIAMAAAMAALGAAAEGHNLFADDRRGYDNTKPYPGNKSLPRWKVGENFIFAKNEKDAIKYAKKRGLYKEGDVVVLDRAD